MRVMLLNIYASPKGTFQPGQVIDLDPHEAQQLIAGRYAEPVGTLAKAASAVATKAAAPEKAAKKQPETSTTKPPKEKAVKSAPETGAAKPPKEKKPKVEPPKPE